MKSQEEFYLRLHALVIRGDPLVTSSSDKRSLEKDIDVLTHRVNHEGLAFLTKSLPLLGKALDQALVSGRFNIPMGFVKSHQSASIPAFMQTYFNLVFDEDGYLRSEASIDAIKHLRQVFYLAYKLELPYSKQDKSAVIDKFVATDQGLASCDSPLANEILALAKIITRKVFHDFDHKDIRPQHGPGAVATGERLDKKWVFSRKYQAIHQVYPYYDYFVVGGARELTDRLDWYKSLENHESGTSKVVLVPKDSRGPRLISCEPLEYQWIQQGLGRKLAKFLEWDSSYTRNHVNFTRQEINSNLAKISSANQRFATVDLRDASDRVSLYLVEQVFAACPNLLRALEACRSTETRLPNGSLVPLKKYAPMGSALCFPVESYIFWVVLVSAVIHSTNLPLVNVGNRIFVYGDDIVVPTNWATICIQALSEVGLEVNMDKTCISGFFRESCGVEAFKGVDVTPSRLRTQWSSHKFDGSALAAYTSFANDMAFKGYSSASQFVFERIEDSYGFLLPYGTPRCSFPCKLVTDPLRAIALNKRTHRWRVNRSYQRIEFFLPSLSPRRIRSELDGWPRMLRDLLSRPYGDPSSVVVPRSTRIKRGWLSVA